MEKIKAITMLVNGECDRITHGKSEFILYKGDIVNKRSKKTLDMKKMNEEGWNALVDPKWYDTLISGTFKQFIAKVADRYVLVTGLSQGQFITAEGYYGLDELKPATEEEVLKELVFGWKPKRRRLRSGHKSDTVNDTDGGDESIGDESSHIEDDGEPDDQSEGEPDPMEQAVQDAEEAVVHDHPKENVVMEDEKLGKTEAEQPKSGTSGVETTSSQKDDSDAYPIQERRTPSPRYRPVFIAAGLHPNNWTEFCEWATGEGYRIEKMVAQGKDVYYPIVS